MAHGSVYNKRNHKIVYEHETQITGNRSNTKQAINWLINVRTC